MKTSVSLFQRLVTTTLLAAGFGILWGVGAQIVRGSAESFDHEVLVEHLFVRADGTPLVQRTSYRKNLTSRDWRIAPEGQFRNLHGEIVSVPRDTRWLRGVSLAAGVREGWVGPFLSPDESWDWRIREFEDDHEATVHWFFISDGLRHGLAYLVGYDRRDMKRIGYIGTAGFRADALPPEEQFPFCGTNRGVYVRVRTSAEARWGGYAPWNFEPEGRVTVPGWDLYVQGDNDTIYRVNLAERTVTVLLSGQPIRSFAFLTRPARVAGAATPLFLAVRTSDEVQVLDERNAVVRRCRIPEELRERDLFWYELPDGDILASWNGEADKSGAAPCHLYWFDDAGQVRRRDETTLQQGAAPDMRVFVASTFPEPIISNLVLMIAEALRRRYPRQTTTLSESFGQVFEEFWPALLVVQVVAVALAILAYRRQLRYGTGRAERITWTLFVLLLGVPAWLAYRYGLSWPILERCPSCGVPVPINRESCPVCHVDSPAPALKGTEVFA